MTSEFVEDKLEKDDGFLEFLLSRLIEPDLKEIIDLIFTGEVLKSKKPISFPQQEGFDLSTYLDTVNDTGHISTRYRRIATEGADVTIPNKENNAILHSAAIDNRAKSLRKLSEILLAISKEGNFTWKQELQRKNGISYTPVMLATDKATIKVNTCIVWYACINWYKLRFRDFQAFL